MNPHPPRHTSGAPPEDGRFAFGENWKRFLSVLNEERIEEATKSLREFLGVTRLDGRTFLDIGSGSGLAARRLGARVHSFDYDRNSVACTEELRRRYFPGDPEWRIEQGSVLDRAYIESLGQFDICYSWGVLHHTNSLWQALYNAQLPVARHGLLYIAIYRDQGLISSLWSIVKRFYCSGPGGKATMVALFYPAFFLGGLTLDLVKLRHPARRYREHIKLRGMSLRHDWADWLGGYPYEVSSAARLQAFYENLGYRLIKLSPPSHGFGNNQLVFEWGTK